MTHGERCSAKASMAQGERIADFLIGAIAAAASIVRGVERGLRPRARSKSAH
jgi:hypothetical protein